MKQYLKYLLGVLLVLAIVTSAALFTILSTPADRFHSTYQSVIQDKFRILKETNDPKIILVAGSSAAFGLDQALLEEATGYKVVNMGLHAGFGPVVPTELSRANINAGDIVVLAYEHTWHLPGSFDTLGTELVMSGFDSNLELYRYLPLRLWPKVLGYQYTFAAKKNQATTKTGQYSREAFDEQTGQMTYPRDYFMRDYETSGLYPKVSIHDHTHIASDVIEYLQEYIRYCRQQGATVVFAAPPLMEQANETPDWLYENIKNEVESELGVPYISDPLDYVYPEVLISNNIYHCNNRGQHVRTIQLINDLHRSGVVTVEHIDWYQLSKTNSLIFVKDVSEYLSLLNDPDYTVLIAVNEDAAEGMTRELQQALAALGLEKTLQDHPGQGYAAVITGGTVTEAQGRGVQTLEGTLLDGAMRYSISSAGRDAGSSCSILLNGQEYARNHHGINIVVINNPSYQPIDCLYLDPREGTLHR